MSFSKMNGINIEYPSYFFTLRDGRFHAFEHYREDDFFAFAGLTRVVTETWEELPKIHPTGYTQLDSAFGGGIPSGSLVNLELASEVHSRTGLVLLGGVMAACVKAGHPVLLFPFEGLDMGFTKNMLKNSMSPARGKLVSQFWKGTEAAEDLTVEGSIRSASRGRRDSAVLTILGPDSLTAESGKDGSLEAFASLVGSGEGAGILVTRGSDKDFSERLSVIGARLIKVSSVGGTLLLQPQRPLGKYFVAEVHKDAESATVDVEPMV